MHGNKIFSRDRFLRCQVCYIYSSIYSEGKTFVGSISVPLLTSYSHIYPTPGLASCNLSNTAKFHCWLRHAVKHISLLHCRNKPAYSSFELSWLLNCRCFFNFFYWPLKCLPFFKWSIADRSGLHFWPLKPSHAEPNKGIPAIFNVQYLTHFRGSQRNPSSWTTINK